MPLEDLNAIIEALNAEPGAVRQLNIPSDEKAAELLGCYIYIGALKELKDVVELLASTETLEQGKLKTFLQERTDLMSEQLWARLASIRPTEP